MSEVSIFNSPKKGESVEFDFTSPPLSELKVPEEKRLEDYMKFEAGISTRFDDFIHSRLAKKKKKHHKAIHSGKVPVDSPDLFVLSASYRTESYWLQCPAGAVWHAVASHLSDEELTSTWSSQLTLWTLPQDNTYNVRELEEGAVVHIVYKIHAVAVPSATTVGMKVPSLSAATFEVASVVPTRYLQSSQERGKLVSVLYRLLPPGLAKDVSGRVMNTWFQSVTPTTRTLDPAVTPHNSPLPSLPVVRSTSLDTATLPSVLRRVKRRRARESAKTALINKLEASKK